MPASTALERRLVSPSAAVTLELGRVLASVAQAGDVLCLWGELGAGKTVFAKGFGGGLGVRTTINSPSFVLMAEHVGRLPLFHLDLYRLAGEAEAVAGGLLDERRSAGVTLVEWPDRLGAGLPTERLDVVIEGGGDEPRSVVLRAASKGHARYLDVAPTTLASRS